MRGPDHPADVGTLWRIVVFPTVRLWPIVLPVTRIGGRPRDPPKPKLR